MVQVERCPWCNSEITRARFLEIQAKIRAEEQRKAHAQEQQIRKSLEEDYKIRLESEKKKAVETARHQTEKALKSKDGQYKKTLELLTTQLAQAKKTLETKDVEIANTVRAALEEQREILDKNRDKELTKKDAEHKREMEKLRSQLKEMNRRLEKKTANELGENSEIDLFETLREEFPNDKIVRVKPGEAGADIHENVMDRNQDCGLIILDSKNHMGWRNEFVTKLRQDQMASKADHAILSTAVFPSGQKELCIMEGVILVNPGRVTYVVQLLREFMIRLHKQALSLEQRHTKVEQLYQLMTSDEYARKLEEAKRLADEIHKLDVEEKKQHDKTWKARGLTTMNLIRTLKGIDDDVYAVIGGKGVEELDDCRGRQQEEVPL